MTARWLLSLGVSLALTLIFEMGFALLCGKRGRALSFVALVNLLTNPAVVCTVLIWNALALPGYWALIAALECSAVLVEGFIYKRSGAGFRRPYLFSLAANAVSYTLGLFVSML